MAEQIIFAITGISICSPLFKTPFTAIMLDGFLLSMKGLPLMNRLLFPSFFFWSWCNKQCWQARLIVPTGDDGSLYEGCSSGELIVIKINEIQLSRKQQSCQKCEHQQSHFDFLNNAYWVSLF
jgi:hypothetical protein